MTFKTPQEVFWANNFGTEYIERNRDDSLLAANIAFFAKALQRAKGIKTCIEFGANIGMNIKALRTLFPALEQHAIEINSDAVLELEKTISPDHIYHDSILNWPPPYTMGYGVD